MSQEQTQTQNKNSDKVGRTVLLKPEKNFDNKLFDNLTGLVDKFYAEGSNSWFLTFKDKDSAKLAYTTMNDRLACKCKYALYRVYFKMPKIAGSGDVDYNVVKSKHSNFIRQKTDGDVLYYKLYRRNEKFLGCG